VIRNKVAQHKTSRLGEFLKEKMERKVMHLHYIRGKDTVKLVKKIYSYGCGREIYT
jgi:hypothetical protein